VIKPKIEKAELPLGLSKEETQQPLFKCTERGCGFSTDSIEDFIRHKISSYNEWLQNQIPKILTNDICIGEVCKKLEGKGYKILKKEEYEKRVKQEGESKTKRDEFLI